MSKPKPGRPKKPGPRYGCGKLVQPATQDRLNQIAASERLAMMATALAQPHRRGVEHPWCSSALGRLCLGRGLRSELYDAGEDYAGLVRRWRAAKGIPTTHNLPAYGDGSGPDDSTVETWTRRIVSIEQAVAGQSGWGFLAMRRVVLDDEDVPSVLHDAATEGLRLLAVHIGLIPEKFHPFVARSA